jgi:hypothetical protein
MFFDHGAFSPQRVTSFAMNLPLHVVRLTVLLYHQLLWMETAEGEGMRWKTPQVVSVVML